MAPPTEIAAPAPLRYPDVRLARGWESAALVVITLLLLSFGLVTLYSTSSLLAQRSGSPDYIFVLRQASAGAVGLVALVFCARLPYGAWRRLAWPVLLAAFALLVLIILPGTEPIAPRINGARRWLRVFGISIQPSEIAKFAVVVWTAGLALRKQDLFHSLRKGLGPFLIVWAAILIPTALEPDLSTAILIGLLGAIVVFTAGARVTHFVFLGVAMLPVLMAQLAVGFRGSRITAWRQVMADPSGAGFQIRQSLIAIGSGGLTGEGFAQGRQKFGFLPEPHTDFMFSMIGEEWGFAGIVVLVTLYLSLILIGFRVARRAPDLFGELLAVGFTSLVAIHATLHMAVGLALVPPTGLPLPLISYGRSNLVVTLAAVGVIVSVARAATLAERRGRRRSGGRGGGVGRRRKARA